MAAIRTDIEDEVKSIQKYLHPIGNDLLHLLQTGLQQMQVTHEEMTKVTGPIDEVTDAMQAAQDVIDHVMKYGYKD
jgi:hypothetical protein